MNHMYDKLVSLLKEQKAIKYCIVVDTLDECLSELGTL